MNGNDATYRKAQSASRSHKQTGVGSGAEGGGPRAGGRAGGRMVESGDVTRGKRPCGNPRKNRESRIWSHAGKCSVMDSHSHTRRSAPRSTLNTFTETPRRPARAHAPTTRSSDRQLAPDRDADTTRSADLSSVANYHRCRVPGGNANSKITDGSRQ